MRVGGKPRLLPRLCQSEPYRLIRLEEQPPQMRQVSGAATQIFRLQVFPFRAQLKEKATRGVVNDNVASNSTRNGGCGSAKYSRDGLALVEGKGN